MVFCAVPSADILIGLPHGKQEMGAGIRPLLRGLHEY